MGNPELVTEWFAANRLKQLIKLLKPGDLLEFRRGLLYSHWGVYVGMRYMNGKKTACVIHLSSPEETRSFDVLCRSQSCGKSSFGLGNITLDRLVDVALESSVRINNSRDSVETAGNSVEILARAERRNGEEYNILRNNCEHFAKYCRYGKKMNNQLQDAATSAILIGGAVCVAAAAIPVLSSAPSLGEREECHALGECGRCYPPVPDNLIIYPESMQKNLDCLNGLVFSPPPLAPPLAHVATHFPASGPCSCP